MKILIKNATVITADENDKVMLNADIGIDGDRIVFLRVTGSPETSEFKAEKVFDGSKRIVMPGLVNGHTHCAMTLFRNYGNDLSLHDWLFTKIFPAEKIMTREEVYWGTMLGMAEMIKSGTTAFADMYIYMQDVVRAVAESGLRASISETPLDAASGDVAKRHVKPGYIEDFHKTWHNAANGRIKVDVFIHSVYLLANDEVRVSVEMAEKLGARIHIHILETEREREDIIERYGTGVMNLCEKLGIFTRPVMAAHCVHMTDADLVMMKKYGVSAVHNPTSNLKLGSGIARVPEMLDLGINVCLGTDGASSNNNLDMFEEMNLAALIHKGAAKDPLLVSAAQAIRMATANGARSLGIGNETGMLKAGMKADLILINTDQPHFKPLNEPMAAVVYSAHGSDVDTVIVDGNILMENRVLKTIDEKKAGEMVCAASQRITSAAT